ncbi:MAG: proton-dependent oligopeptide transporter, family [Acidobacteriota bacterium]|jgi:POT family proton-dependent oligopeptide transporter|nr:proton-dependent oligopeptide transporter, family [Acidobacteriota bacterium]
MATSTTEKHPRGLYVLFGTEMWERFSFYTVNAMLALYLRDTVQGFGFSNARASSVVSTYNMFIYFTPLLGGLIADRLTGYRRAIMMGGVAFMIGHALLAVPNSLFVCYAALTFLVIGNGFFKPNVSSMVGNLYREGSHLKDKAYVIFYMGINVGALVAPILANFIQPRWGFHPAFFMGAIGMILSLIVFGVNQKWVRQADRVRNKIDPQAVATSEDLPPKNEAASLMDAVPEWKRIVALVVVFLIVIVFWMVFHQNSISLTFWANDHSIRLPGILSNAINPLWIIILSLPLAWFWGWLDKRNMEPGTPVKIMIGMMLTGLSFVILYFAANTGGFTKPVFKVVQSTPAETWVAISPEAREHLGIKTAPTKLADGTSAWRVTNSAAGATAPGEYVRYEGGTDGPISVAPTKRVSAMWLIIAYMVLSLGELMLSPMGLALVSKVAPIRMRGLMMGGWFAATAIGNKLTGVAKYWDLWSHAHFFILLASMALFMAVVLLFLLRPLKKAMPGV